MFELTSIIKIAKKIVIILNYGLEKIPIAIKLWGLSISE